jgi:hypothetical protein
MLSLENLTLVNNANADDAASDFNIPNSTQDDPLGTLKPFNPIVGGSGDGRATNPIGIPIPQMDNADVPIDVLIPPSTQPVQPQVPQPVVETPIVVEPTPLVPTPPVVIEPTPQPLVPIVAEPISNNCYTFTLTNVSNQRYDIGYTDCCTGEAVNFTLMGGEKMDNCQYTTTNFNTTDLVASNIVQGCIPKVITPSPLAPTPAESVIAPAVMPPIENVPTPIETVAPIIPNSHPINDPVGTKNTSIVETIAPTPEPAPINTQITQTPTTPTTTPKPTATAIAPVGQNINYLVIGLGAVLVVLIAGKLMSNK